MQATPVFYQKTKMYKLLQVLAILTILLQNENLSWFNQIIYEVLLIKKSCNFIGTAAKKLVYDILMIKE